MYSGDSNFSGSTSPIVTEMVNPGATATVVTSSTDPSVSGQDVTYTAIVTATAPAAGTPTGTVTFMDGPTIISGCIAQAMVGGVAPCASVYAGVGGHAITAVYSGDANFTSSTSPILTQTVNQGATSTLVASSADPSVSGQDVTYTATVAALAPASGTPSGTATFMDGATTIGGCIAQPLIGGVAACSIAYPGVGSQAITAVSSGDLNFMGSTSPILTQTVSPASTSTVLWSSVNPSVTGQSVTVTATVSVVAPGSGVPTGTVAFLDDGTTIAGCAAQAVTGAGVATCDDVFGAADAETITAVYSGDADFSSSTSAALTQTINPGATSTVVTSSVDPSVSGESLFYTAAVNAIAPAGGTPTGTVAFLDGASTIAGCGAQPLVAGTASCTVTYAGVGTHAITAVYSGDANFATSTSPILTQTVDQGATATFVTSSVDPSVTGQNVTYTTVVTAPAPASGTPTGTAEFLDGASTISGCGAQPLVGGVAACNVVYASAGSHAITVIYSGDPNFTGSTSSVVTQTVNPAATSTAVASSVNPSVTGQSVTITATVTVNTPGSGTPTGTVSFEDGATTIAGCAADPVIGTGMATCADTFAAAGAEAITAVYSGDVNFISSTSPVLTQTINQGGTATLVVSSVHPSVSGEWVSYTSVVTAVVPAAGTPTGTVAFFDGASTIAGCGAEALVAGMASCNVTYAGVGTHSITAIYSGDPNFFASTSPVLTQTVNPGPTSTVVTSSADPSVSGESLSYSAAVTAVAPAAGTPSGTVAFLDGASTIAGCGAQLLVAGTASCNVTYAGVGIHAITAVYSGDADFSGSTSAALTQTINQGVTATALTSTVNPSVSGKSVSYTAVVTALAPASGIPTGTATFMDGATAISGCVAQPLVGGVAACSVVYAGIGAHAITAIYNGDPNFTASTSPILTQTVNPGATSTVVTSSVNPSVSGEAVSYTATVTAVAPAAGTPTGTVAFLDGASTIAGCAAQPLVAGTASCTATYAGVGSHGITTVYSGDPNFISSTSPILTQTVNPGATSTLLSSSSDPTVTGQNVTYTAAVAALAPASGMPTGTATFMDGATTISGCIAQPLVGGVAACSVMYAGVGTHEITAIYSGDPNFTASTSQLLTQTINPAATATSLASSLNPSVTGQQVTITATVNVTAPGSGSPTGTVAFMDGAVPIAACAAQALAGGTATCATSFDTAGASAITAAYIGDPNFTGSTSSAFSQTTDQGATAAVVVSSANPSVASQGVSYTATVSAVAPASGIPTGTVAFLDGASTIPGCATQALIAGMASCSVPYNVAGNHAITAVYSGDANFAASTSAPLNQVVVLAESATTLTSPASIWAAGQPGIFEATVIPLGPAHVTPTGTAVFMDAGAPIPGCAAQPVVSGNASCSAVFTRIGTDRITAIYSGDAALTGSTAPTLMLSVYDDPPTPDAGANPTTSTSLAYAAILGGVVLVFLVGCARLRRRDVDRD